MKDLTPRQAVAIFILIAFCIIFMVIQSKQSAVYPSENIRTRGTMQTVMSQSHEIQESSKEQQRDEVHFRQKSSRENGNTETIFTNLGWKPSLPSPKNAQTDMGARRPGRPNIVFIMADDLGFNDVGYHNKNGVSTPTIDKLAREGVRLENYYVQPICSPSRIQFMSGRKLIHTGIVHKLLNYRQPYGLPLDSLTLADKLKDAGYNTDMVGKWHLGYYQEEYLPTRRGFDTFYGFYTGGGDHFSHKNCNDDVCRLDLHNDTVKQRKMDYGQGGVYSSHLYTDEAIRVINHRSKGDKPLFLYLSYQAVHTPVQAPSEYVDRVTAKIKQVFQSKQRKNFVGMTLAMDDGIARVVKSLKDNGMWNNTVLIFSTDNGGKEKNGGSNLPLKGEKFTFYEGGVRAVGFVNSPLLEKTGYVNKELIHITDWFTTFIALANGNLRGTRDVEGFNQWDAINRGTPSPREEILYNIDPWSKSEIKNIFNHRFDTRVLSALRIGRYKIITGLESHPGLALYNLKDDPFEEHDLSMDEAYRWKVIDMLDALLIHSNTAKPTYYPPRCDINSTVIDSGILC